MAPVLASLGYLYVAAGFVSLVFVAVALRHRENPGSSGFILVTAAMSLWAFSNGASKFVYSLEASALLYNVVMLCGGGVVLGLFLMASEFTGYFEVTRRRLLAAAAPLALVQAVIWTNGLHHLFILPGAVMENGVFFPEYGPAYWLHVAVSYSYVAAAVIILSSEVASTQGKRRLQAVALLFSILPTVVGNLVSVIDLFGLVYDVTPFGYIFSEVILAWALFGLQYPSLVPVARKRVLEKLEDPVVILDSDNALADYNSAAGELFDLDSGDLGKPPATLESFKGALEDSGEGSREKVVVEESGKRLYYDLSVSMLGEEGSTEKGRVLVFRDITEQKETERELRRSSEELEVLNRVVRHDITNDLNLIFGKSFELDEYVESDHGKEILEEIESATNHALEVARTAQDLVDTVMEGEGPDLGTVDAVQLIEEELEKIQASFREAEITFTTDVDEAKVRADALLSSVVRNLVNNAVIHNDKEYPKVEIAIAREEDETFLLSIADNGPGIPDDHKDDLFGKGEKGLESPGTGIGLYLVRKLVDSYGGQIEVRDNDPEGTVFEVRLKGV